jgi:hypothetical protein
MEDSKGSYIHEDAIRGLNINLRNVKTKSNGHRSRVDPVELIETMKNMQREM